MSNKIQLQTNNASLDDYIARINAAKDVAAGLPEAGGGTNVETCAVTINYVDTDFSGLGSNVSSTIYCNTLDNSGNIQSTVLQSGVDFEFTAGIWGSANASITINNIVKNSILVIMDSAAVSYNKYVQHDFELISSPDQASPRVFIIKQDGTIVIS
jgi:hypothetical protein